MANREKVVTVTDFFFPLGSKITVDSNCSHKIKMLTPWKKSYNKRRQHIKKQGHHFSETGLYSQSYDFSSSHVWMWELDHKEGWEPKNFCTVVLEKTLEIPLDTKEIKSVSPHGNQAWIFIGKTDAEAEAPITLATWCGEPTLCKRPWCWQRLKARGDNRGWDGWMTLLTQCTSLSKFWETVKNREAWCAAVQGLRHKWVTEQQMGDTSIPTLKQGDCLLQPQPKIPGVMVIAVFCPDSSLHRHTHSDIHRYCRSSIWSTLC